MSDCPARLVAGVCFHNRNLMCAQKGFAVQLQSRFHMLPFIFTLHKMMINLISVVSQ